MAFKAFLQILLHSQTLFLYQLKTPRDCVLMAMAIDQAESNKDAANRVGQRLPLNVWAAEGLRSQCSLVGGRHLILRSSELKGSVTMAINFSLTCSFMQGRACITIESKLQRGFKNAQNTLVQLETQYVILKSVFVKDYDRLISMLCVVHGERL